MHNNIDIKDILATYRYCKSVAFFEAYLDESGTHDGAVIACVAGAIAKRSSWLAIDGQWRTIYKKFGITAFHASELSSYKGEFKEWTEDKRKGLTYLLLQALEREGIVPVASSVRVETLAKVQQEFPEFPVTPYQFCAEICLVEIGVYAVDRKRMAPVAVTFAAGQKYNSVAMAAMLALFESETIQHDFKIKQISFLQPKGVVPLQVADLIAYEVYREICLRGPDSRLRPMRYPMASLIISHGIPVGSTLGEDDIRKHFFSMQQHLSAPGSRKNKGQH